MLYNTVLMSNAEDSFSLTMNSKISYIREKNFGPFFIPGRCGKKIKTSNLLTATHSHIMFSMQPLKTQKDIQRDSTGY